MMREIIKKIFRVNTLSRRITFTALAFLALLSLSLAALVYQITRNWLEEISIANLEALASSRQLAVESYIDTHLQKLAAFEQPDLEIQVDNLINASTVEKENLTLDLIADLQRKQLADETLAWVDILDTKGAILLSTFPERIGIFYGNEEFFSYGMVRPYISDPFFDAGRIYIKLSQPLHNANNQTIAVLVMRYDASELLAITGNYTGLGETGETVLGTRIGDEIHFLAPLRFDPNLSQIPPAPADGERAKPMIHATSGQSGVTQAPDYRDTTVVAAYRPILSTNWGIVVKQDADEAFASITQIQTALLVTLLSLFAVGIVFISPTIKRALVPLRELQKATSQVAKGNLNTRVPIQYDDEIGDLAKTFNIMVDRLQETQTEIERSNEELSSFAYVVSHDLKAPLRAINQLAGWIVDDHANQLNDDGKELLELMIGRVQRMHDLIEGILEYSRIGQIQEKAQNVNLAVLVPEVINSLHQKEIKVEIQGSLPKISGEPTRFRQIFQNLIENGIKYHDKPNGWVRISCEDQDTHWCFSISDNGPGIDQKYHEKIFQLFQTLAPRDQVESTGVGLAVIKKFIEMSNEKIWVESSEGNGSTFNFTWSK